MPEVTRRRLLSSAAAGAGGVLASSLLPPALARAAAEGARRGSLRDVKHVVIHMQENRSFDHYFGTLGGVAGFGDPNALIQTDPTPPFNSVQGKSIFYQYEPAGTGPGQNPDGYLLPWHLDTKSTSAQAIPSTSHAWYYQHDALNITVPTTAGQPTTAYNNNWLPAHLMADGDRPRPVHDGLLRAPGHPVPLRAGRDVHAVRPLLLLAARPDLAQPHVPDDRDDRSRGQERRPGHLERRPQPRHRNAVHVDDLPRAPDRGRDQLAHLPGRGRLRHQRAGVLRGLPGREARLAAVRGRPDDLPAGPVRVGRQARQAADRLVDRPDLGPERAPVLPAGLGGELPGLQAERGGREPRSLELDRVHRQLRRERRAVRPRRTAAAAGRHEG